MEEAQIFHLGTKIIWEWSLVDQLINNAAKWKFMFGGQQKSPIIIRLIVGRGWGQGPTHSQNFQNMLANVPGLKIFIPSFFNNIFMS